jgi:ribonuclease I
MFDNTDAGARQYFELGVDKATQLQRASTEINALAGQSVPTARIRGIVEKVTGKPIQTACDANAATRLLEIHSCYNNDGSPKACPTMEAFGPLVPCGEQVELPVWSTTPKSSPLTKPAPSPKSATSG